MKINVTLHGVLAALLLVIAQPASAALSSSFQFNGNGNWSIDGVGSNSTPVGDISAVVPTGSTIVVAFLYSTTTNNSSAPTVVFDGTSYSGADWTELGANGFLEAYRADVTTQIAAAVGGGSDSPFTFTVGSESPNGSTDGEVLAIIYSNPNEEERTIAFLDGFSASTGDSSSINLSSPLTAAQLADPDFEAIMSLGIGFGFQPSGQFSQVDVNGQRLTSSAGGQDDGAATNGGLITVGGLGDSIDNPDPFATDSGGPRTDDELYSLLSFLAAGDTAISIDTLNPSRDDNIFFEGFNITARAGVDQPPPPPDEEEPPIEEEMDPDPTAIPEPGTLFLFGAGLLGLAASRRRLI